MDRLKELRKAIKQPLEGLLYDLDLMPEQCKTLINELRSSVVECQYKEIERLKEQKRLWKIKALRLIGFLDNKDKGVEQLKKEKEWLLNRCLLRESWTQTICKSDDELEKNITERMQQALKEKK